jgi:hypothetical protein
MLAELFDQVVKKKAVGILKKSIKFVRCDRWRGAI